MRSYELLLAFAASAAASPANLFNRAGCNADNCLRAIRNTARPGLADCSSYLAAIVTPATSTVYETTTHSTTPTLTFEVTHTITHLATSTEDVHETTTETITNTRWAFPGVQTVRKRQATVIPSDIPTYASACSGSVRYTSACACLGATATTITVDAPKTTVTLSETVTPTFVSQYITVQTDEITVTDATVTNTVVATATATVEVTKTFPKFNVRVNGGPRHDGQYLQQGFWLQNRADSLLIRPGKAADGKSLFFIDGDGGLRVVGGPEFTYSSTTNVGPAHWILNADSAGTDRPKCRVTSDMKLKCSHGNNANSALTNCSYWTAPFAGIWNGLGSSGSSCYELDLIVEPVV